MNRLVAAVRDAGVVGAGGAGFPTQVKMRALAGTVIANGAECEPLLSHDRANMTHHPDKVVRGLEVLSEAVGARRKVIAIKDKYTDAKQALDEINNSFEICPLPDYYPVGDEVEIVKHVVGDTVPENGLPLDIGVVVDNVETLMNIADAVEGIAVTHRYVTVCGEVVNPKVLRVPVGTKIIDAVKLCGGVTTDQPKYYIGGPMMGRMVEADEPIIKTTTGVFVLPEDHFLIQKRSLRIEHILRQAQSACTDCRLCTDSCPRFLLGYDIEPHKIMRTVNFAMEGMTREVMSAHLCCSCGVCEYACPMWLSPRRVYEKTLDFLKDEGVDFDKRERELAEHPMRKFRRIPSSRLLFRMGLAKYDVEMEYDESDWMPDEVVIPMLQHIGAAAEPVISGGDKVLRGEVIGEIPTGELGARVHASIDGAVTSVNKSGIVIKAR